jgi:hypothetical protein
VVLKPPYPMVVPRTSPAMALSEWECGSGDGDTNAEKNAASGEDEVPVVLGYVSSSGEYEVKLQILSGSISDNLACDGVKLADTNNASAADGVV